MNMIKLLNELIGLAKTYISEHHRDFYRGINTQIDPTINSLEIIFFHFLRIGHIRSIYIDK